MRVSEAIRRGIIGPVAPPAPPPPSWSPEELGAKLLAWWDPADAASLSLSGDTVTAFTDKKGGHVATQSGATSLRPVLQAGGLNGRDCLLLDGVDDHLNLSSQPFPGGSEASEIWALVDQVALGSASGQRYVLAYGGGSAASRRALSRETASFVNRARVDIGDGSITHSFRAPGDFSGICVAALMVSPTTSRAMLNGQEASTNLVPATGFARVRIGASDGGTAGGFWSGKIGMLLVTRELGAAERQALLNYLKQLGGIA